MYNNYRLHTNISQDQVVRAKLTQDIDFLEILSLKIKQEDTYKLHVSEYGIIVGRVLANEAFGIPNAKVSVFIPLDDADKLNTDISTLYPYTDIQTKDNENRRYNLLPDDSNDICYRVVGSFPNKRYVLDNNTQIEVFDKYWKFTSVTNKSGDYMIFGVPTGTHQVHVDVDLSDIGVLSQKPRDFLYKGYNISQFDNSSQFKESTNLDNLSQLLSQTSSVYVYPFWGDKDVEEIAITRCDLQVQYKFEPTCVFFGSVISDNYSNNIGDKCNPSNHVGFNRNLIAGEGTIEMIRKTKDGLVEEYQIQGNRLIDGNGVWCYQIPMNLDYVGTDEFGNIVPTDNPNKGVPTRTSVRFRFSFQETNNEGVSRHRAKYLVPNNPKIDPNQKGVYIVNPNQYLQCYEFGSATTDEYFRDLYWNKVYSVKNYIPRIQIGSSKNTQKYSAIRTVNDSGNLNPFPFNHARFRLYFGYRVLCVLLDIIFTIICGLNGFVSKIAGWRVPIIRVRIFSWVCSILSCIGITGGLTEDEDNNIEYFPCCSYGKCMKCEQAGCKKETRKSRLMDTVQQSLSQEYDTVNLDFYNDWINGCLYFPLWFWRKTKKKKFLFGLFTKKAINRYCNCDSNYSKLRVTENCALSTDQSYNVVDGSGPTTFHYIFPKNTTYVKHGIIKEVENKDGLKIYYYAPGVPTTTDYRDTSDPISPYVRLYSTDIILLGSLNDCDLDNLPRPFVNLPSTTANIPYISTLRDDSTEKEIDEDGTENSTGVIEVSGMDWLGNVNDGLFMDLTCTRVKTKPKTCINLSRMCELGVTLDTRYYDVVADKNGLKYDNEKPADGMITRYELVDNETRAMFASLNHNGLSEKTYNPNTGYETYKLIYNYPLDFDGHMNKYSVGYTSNWKLKTYDNKDQSYIDYKFGVVNEKCQRHFYSISNNNQFPLFNNSFYFYFGLNEGNTAIDKFNNLFYSSCFKNYKYPFNLSYVFTPAKWCKAHSNYEGEQLNINDIKNSPDLSTDYATITITIDNIKLPYSYQLYDDNNNLLLSEDNLFDSTLKFGYEIVDGKYTDNKFGALQSTNGDFVTINDTYAYVLDNTTYNLVVTDVNGNSITQPLNINQAQLSMTVSVLNLGDKYYSGVTNESDICNEYAYYGEIIINSINIDGKDYKITQYTEVKENDTLIGYNLTCKLDDKNYSNVLLQIEPSQDVNFEDCVCHAKPYKPYLDSSSQMHFNIWVPDDYKITITQYCNGVLNDNTSSDTISVGNGSPFLTYLSDTPLKFIVGKNTNIDNSNFYSLKVNDTIPNGWFNVHDESVYRFEPVNKQDNISIWNDFVETDFYTDDNGNITDISLSSKVNILSYKYQCLMDMSILTYIDDTNEKNITYTTSGGKAPILYRGCYPQYMNFSDDYTKTVTYDTTIFDSDASITCLSRTANIISNNYTQYNANKDCWELVIPNGTKSFNLLFKDNKYLGNYFAAFTSNAGMEYTIDDEGNGKWEQKINKYEANPYKADPYVNNVNPGESVINNGFSNMPFLYDSTSQSNPYFRALTVDRRLDYGFFIMMPFNGDNLFNTNNEWNKGRLVGYQINGIEMAYDNNYNIIGTGIWNKNNKTYTYDNKLEYYFPVLYTDTEEEISCFTDGEALNIHYTTDLDNKRLYSCTIRTDKTYNIKNYFWGKWNTKKTITPDSNSLLKWHDYSTENANSLDVNGAFSEDNYPCIRRIDVYSIPSSSIFTFSAKSCKYENNLEFIDNGGSQYSFNGYAIEGEETTFSLNGDTSIKIITDSIDACASNGVGNVSFNGTENEDHSFTFKCKNLNITFTLPLETTNMTHRAFSSLPYYMSFKVRDSNNNFTNPLNDIKLMKLNPNKKYTDALYILLDEVYRKLNLQQLTSSQIINNNDSGFSISKTIPTNIFHSDMNHLTTTDSEHAIIYDDDSFMRNISYKLNTSYSTPPDIISILYYKHFINNEGDNLSKDILTLNVGAMIDARPFDMYYILEIDDTMSGSGNTEIEVPNSGVDEEGNPVTGSTTSSGETNVTISRQVSTFYIKIPSATDDTINQQFKDTEKMVAALKYDKKVISDATFSIEDNKLAIKFIWGGALSGVLVGDQPKPAELYLKIANNLIYKLMFTLKKIES